MIKLPGGDAVLNELMFDWLVDRLAGRPQPNRGQVVWVEPGTSPNDPQAARKRRWFDTAH